MNLQVVNTKGEAVDTVEVDDSLFAAPINRVVVHQVMVAQLANARQGTSKAKTRAEVSGGGAKPRPQKHTGRARQGSIRSIQWRGGGVAFGPRPRSYRQRTPRKVRRLALKSLLSSKAQEGEIVVLQDLALSEPRTRTILELLENLKIEESSSVLIVTNEAEPNVIKSARNLKGVKTLPVPLLNIVDLLNHRVLIMTVDAVRKAEELWAGPFVRFKSKVSSLVQE